MLSHRLKVSEKPISVGAAAVYPASAELRRQFTLKSRFGDVYKMYREFGSGSSQRVLIPRNCAPLHNDRRVEGSTAHFESSFKPRSEEQERVVRESSLLLAEGRSHLIRAPTGFGKTACAMQLIANVGKKTLVVVTKEDVKTQWAEAFRQFLGVPRAGVFQGDNVPERGSPVAIAMIQSVAKFGRYPRWMFDSYGLVIWDEVHLVGADVFSNTGWIFPAKLRLGLSATPHRKDGKEQLLFGHIGNIEVETDLMSLVPHVVIVRSGIRLPRRKKRGTNHYEVIPHMAGKHAHITRILAGNRERNAMIARFVSKAYRAGRNIIVFSDRRDHLERLRDALARFKVPMSDVADYVGGLTTDERERAKAHRVLLSTYSMASYATDIPWLDTAVLATPRSDVVQIIGRILREYPGKKEPMVLDILDDDSEVFKGYSQARRKWYRTKGAEVQFVSRDQIYEQ